MEVLNKGLGFIPNIDNMIICKTSKDLTTFERKLQLHFHFKFIDLLNNHAQTEYVESQHFSLNSEWWPRPLYAHITSFCRSLKFLINKTIYKEGIISSLKITFRPSKNSSR